MRGTSRWVACLVAIVLVATMVAPVSSGAIPAGPPDLEFVWQNPTPDPWVGTSNDVVHGPDGNVYVADEEGWVSRYTPDGEFLGYIGVGGDLTPDQELDEGTGIAFDASGTIWVADYSDEVVKHYTLDNQYLGELTDSLCCPMQPAVDASNNVYVVDDDGYVYKYDPEGNLVDTWYGNEADEDSFCEPEGIAVGPDGLVWVSDTCEWGDGETVEAYTTDGEFVKQIDSSTFEGPGFDFLNRLHFAPDGSLWSAQNSRVWRFDIDSLQPIAPANERLYIDGGEDSMSYLVAASADASGSLWACSDDGDGIWRGSLDTFAPAAAPAAVSEPTVARTTPEETKDGERTECKHPRHDDADKGGSTVAAVRPSAVTPLVPYSPVFEGLIECNVNGGGGTFNFPYASIIGTDGLLWTGDVDDRRIWKVDPADGSIDGSVTVPDSPWGLSVSPTGTIFASGGWTSMVLMLDANGTEIGRFGGGGSEPGQFSWAGMSAFDDDGAFYIADMNNNRVQRFATDGSIRIYNAVGDDSWLSQPEDVAIASDGDLLVADAGNRRIVRYAPDGSLVSTWTPTDAAGDPLSYPSRMDVDSAGRVYVADVSEDAVYVYDDEGVLLGAYRNRTPEEGGIIEVIDVVADGRGNVFVTDGRVPRIVKLRLTSAIERIDGGNRFEVGANAAAAGFPDWAGVKRVVIASNDRGAQADPIIGSGFAGAVGAPLLLVSKGGVPDETAAALKQIVARNGRITVFVVGGTGTIPPSVISEITSLVGARNLLFDRIRPDGDRYELAASVALRMKKVLGPRMGRGVFYVNGTDEALFDAVGVAPLVARTRMPILLVRRTSIPEATWRARWQLPIGHRFVVGGANRISEWSRQALDVYPHDRFGQGANTYASSASIANRAIQERWVTSTKVGVVAAISDGAAAAAHAGRTGMPLLTTSPSALSPATRSWITAHKGTIESCVAYGGDAWMTPAVLAGISDALQ